MTQETNASNTQPQADAHPPAQPPQGQGQPPRPADIRRATPSPTPGDSTGETDAAPDSTNTRTLSQEQLDRLIGERLQAERAKYADYDELKAKVQEAENAQKTEAERTAERIQQLETQNREMAERSRKAAVDLALTQAASSAGLPPKAAVRLVDASAIEFDEAGNVANADALINAVAEEWPQLRGRQTPPQQPLNPPGGQQPAGRTDDDRRREYFGGGGNVFRGGGVRMPDQ